MANKWFRLYSEFSTDPKIQVLTEALQRRYVMLLCIHCSENYEKRPDDEISLALRVTVEDWQETKKEFIKRGLLLPDGTIRGWEKRQFISDIKDPTAKERQKRYRESKRYARNDTVTSRLPESDTDTETDKKHNAQDESFAVFWSLYPNKKAKSQALKSWIKIDRDLYGQIIESLKLAIKSDGWTKDNGKFIPHPSTWLNGKRWEDELTVKVENKPFDVNAWMMEKLS